MSNDAPATLTRLLDEMPVGQPPLADVLASGRAAKRRQRRLQVGMVSLAVLVVIGGSFAFSRVLGPTDSDTLVADGATNGNELHATVEVDPDALTSRELVGGEAVWDPSDGALLYASGPRYSSSCPPEPTLSNDDGSLSLALAYRAGANRVCTSDAVPVLVTVTGLESPPERLTVSEEGNPSQVVEVTVVPSPPAVNEPGTDTVYGGLSCPFSEQTRAALDIPGPGQPTPQEAVAPFLGSLSISAVHTKERAAQVIANDADGAAVIVYTLTKQEDGWWPDGYTECRR